MSAIDLKATRALDERALRTLFLEARTANGFLLRPVPHSLIGFCRVKWRPSESRLHRLAPGERSDRCYAASM
jgi:hypothetical protein